MKKNLIIIIFFIIALCNCSTKKNSIDFIEFKKIELKNKDIRITHFGITEDYFFTWSINDGWIKVFDKEGKEICSYGKKGKAPGEFMRIVLVNVNKNNIIAVVDNILSRITYLKFSNNKIDFIKSINITGSIIDFNLLDNNDVIVSGLFMDNNKPSLIKKINFSNNEGKNFIFIDEKKLKTEKEAISCIISPLVIDNRLYLHYFSGTVEIYEIDGDNLKFIAKKTYLDNDSYNRYSNYKNEINLEMGNLTKFKNEYAIIFNDPNDKKKSIINTYNKKSDLIAKKIISLEDSSYNCVWNTFSEKENTISYLEKKNMIFHLLKYTNK